MFVGIRKYVLIYVWVCVRMSWCMCGYAYVCLGVCVGMRKNVLIYGGYEYVCLGVCVGMRKYVLIYVWVCVRMSWCMCGYAYVCLDTCVGKVVVWRGGCGEVSIRIHE